MDKLLIYKFFKDVIYSQRN